jgi:hypothetical protein
MADYSPEAVDETIRLALYDPDSRVRTINLQQVLDRGLGKVSDLPPAEDGRVVDISHLSPADQKRLDEAFAVIHELLGIGPGAVAK